MKPTLDELLASARGDEPREEQLASLDRKVAPLFVGPPGGGGGGGGAGGSGAGAGAAGGAVKSGVALKWIAGALAIAIGGGIAVRSAMTDDETAAPPPLVVPAPAAPPPAAQPAPAPPSPAPVVKPPPRARPAASSLVDESQQLERARGALQAGDATSALEICERHSRNYPRGELREERERIAIEALVALGRHDAAVVRAKRFDLTFPNSVQSERIHALLDHR